MNNIIEERTLAANGNDLAERLLLITGNRAVATYDVWSDDPDDKDVESLTFPDMEEECWFSILGDNAMGSLVDICNNEEGHLILTGHFGDDGLYDFNIHTTQFLQVQKIVAI